MKHYILIVALFLGLQIGLSAFAQDNMTCGYHAFFQAAKELRPDVTVQALRDIKDAKNGLTFADLIKMADSFGLHAYSLQLNEKELEHFSGRFIAHLSRHTADGVISPHYVTLIPLYDGRVQVCNPPAAPFIARLDDLDNELEGWTGAVLLISEKAQEVPIALTVVQRTFSLSVLTGVFLLLVGGTIAHLLARGRRRVLLASSIAALAVVAFVTADWALASYGHQIAALPKAVINTPSLDLGKHQKAGMIPFAAKLSNEGTADLVVEEVKSDCGCTTAVLKDKVVHPGRSTNVEGTLSLAKVGRRDARLFISTNDPAHEHLQIFLHGELVADYEWTVSNLKATIREGEASPAPLNTILRLGGAGSIDGNGPSQNSKELQGRTRIVGKMFDDKRIRAVEVAPTDEAGDPEHTAYSIRVTPAPYFPGPKKDFQTIRFFTDANYAQSIDLTVELEYVPHIAVAGETALVKPQGDSSLSGKVVLIRDEAFATAGLVGMTLDGQTIAVTDAVAAGPDWLSFEIPSELLTKGEARKLECHWRSDSGEQATSSVMIIAAAAE